MFEDLDKKTNMPAENPVKNSAMNAPKAGTEDIFAGTENVISAPPPKPDIFSKKPDVPADFPAYGFDDHHHTDIKKYAVAGIIIVLIILFFAGLWYIYNVMAPSGEKVPAQEPAESQLSTENKDNAEDKLGDEKDPAQATAVDPGAQPATGPDIDSDSDGLFDSEEKQLGSDPKLLDTDSDGLYDREEVKVYNTNPVDPDTDKDSYDDGTEVKGGFNPNGEGKLYEIK